MKLLDARFFGPLPPWHVGWSWMEEPLFVQRVGTKWEQLGTSFRRLSGLEILEKRDKLITPVANVCELLETCAEGRQAPVDDILYHRRVHRIFSLGYLE
jgi:hypothetical protein